MVAHRLQVTGSSFVRMQLYIQPVSTQSQYLREIRCKKCPSQHLHQEYFPDINGVFLFFIRHDLRPHLPDGLYTGKRTNILQFSLILN